MSKGLEVKGSLLCGKLANGLVECMPFYISTVEQVVFSHYHCSERLVY